MKNTILFGLFFNLKLFAQSEGGSSVLTDIGQKQHRSSGEIVFLYIIVFVVIIYFIFFNKKKK